VQSYLTQLKTYKNIKNHKFRPSLNEKLAEEELLQRDIHYGIALIEGIINPAHERSK
jgi:hypothetical protein